MNSAGLRFVHYAILIGGVCFAAHHAYSAAPYVHTQPAGPIRSTNATLNGMVVPRGEATTAWFEWGTDTSYGNTTAPVGVGNGTTTVRVQQELPDLMARKVYHFRLMASNGSGTVAGSDTVLVTGANVESLYCSGISNMPNLLPSITNAVGIACGHAHSFVLKDDGTVFVWVQPRDMPKGQANVPEDLTNVVCMAGGYSHCLAAKADGSVVAWGVYTDGTAATVPPNATNVIALAAGDFHSMALTKEGKVLTWGGPLASGITVPAGLSNVVAIAAGAAHSLALKADGTVVAWGGLLSTEYAAPAWLTNVVAISSEATHNLALLAGHTVVSWGRNYQGETNIPPGLSDVLSISAGFRRSVVVTNGGKALGWGSLSYAGSINPDQSDLIAVASGDDHTIALTLAEFGPCVSPASVLAPDGEAVISPFVYRISMKPMVSLSSIPTNGAVYQYADGARGAPITEPGTAITDGKYRFIYVPKPSTLGTPADAFTFQSTYSNSLFYVAKHPIWVIPPPVIGSIHLDGSGTSPNCVVTFDGFSNVGYRLKVTTDFTNWTLVGGSTQSTSGSVLSLIHTNVPQPGVGFYKLEAFPGTW